MSLRFCGAGGTHAGKRRSVNEDHWLWLPEAALAVVADGVGGHASGEIASRTVVEAVARSVAAGLAPELGIEAAHQTLRSQYATTSARPPASTILVAAFGPDGNLRIAWAGDCRLYRWRDGRLQALTRDHSMVEELFRAGALTEEEARLHPRRNVITRAVGLAEHAQVRLESETVAAAAGDRYLLCSDGVHGYLPTERMEALIGGAPDPTEAVARLIRAVIEESEAGDNLTAVCCFVEPET